MSVKSEPCPTTGNGVHTWLLSQANRCRNGGLAHQATFQWLREAVCNCGRVVPDREIQAAVDKAFESDFVQNPQHEKGRRNPSRTKRLGRPCPDPQLIEAVAASGFGLQTLWEASPLVFEDQRSHTEEIIDALFPGDPLLAAAKDGAWFAHTMPRSHWRGHLEWCALIVPSPMTASSGISQEGKVSKRCLDNTGPRRFLVVEFDSGTLDSQAARMLHIAQFAPLAVALYSGGKSLHGWFPVAGFPEPKVRKFFRYAVALGADPRTWSRCQMIRVPDGLNKDGIRQTVFYFNPKLLEIS